METLRLPGIRSSYTAESAWLLLWRSPGYFLKLIHLPRFHPALYDCIVCQPFAAASCCCAAFCAYKASSARNKPQKQTVMLKTLRRSDCFFSTLALAYFARSADNLRIVRKRSFCASSDTRIAFSISCCASKGNNSLSLVLM